MDRYVHVTDDSMEMGIKLFEQGQENEVLHIEALFLLLILPLVCVLQNGVQFGGLLAGILRGIDLFIYYAWDHL